MTTPTLMDEANAWVEAREEWLLCGPEHRVNARAKADKAHATFAARCAETEAEMERLKSLCGEGAKAIGTLRAAVHERDQLLARVADVLRRYSTFAGFEDLAALMKELEP